MKRRLLLLAAGLAFALTIISSGCTRAVRPSQHLRTTAAEGRVVITYLGAAGWHLQHGEHILLVDPYFTRASVDDENQLLISSADAVARYAPRSAEVILVGHSHYDHLLDVPTIAAQTGAVIVGSERTLSIVKAAGIAPEKTMLAVANHQLQSGPFSIRPIASLHASSGEPPRETTEEVRWPLAAIDFTEGGTLAYLVEVSGKRILFIGSANFAEEGLKHVHPDVAIIAIALREKVPAYSCRLMAALDNPELVMPNHFDAHWEPLTAMETRMDDDQRRDLGKFREEVRSCSGRTEVRVPEAFHPQAL